MLLGSVLLRERCEPGARFWRGVNVSGWGLSSASVLEKDLHEQNIRTSIARYGEMSTRREHKDIIATTRRRARSYQAHENEGAVWGPAAVMRAMPTMGPRTAPNMHVITETARTSAMDCCPGGAWQARALRSHASRRRHTRRRRKCCSREGCSRGPASRVRNRQDQPRSWKRGLLKLCDSQTVPATALASGYRCE
jgi:hypothetical protein